MNLWPALIGLIIAIPSAALGYLGYRRSMRVDKVAEQAGIATTHATSIGQVVDGLNKLTANLQSDNEILRQQVVEIRLAVERCQARIDAVEEGNVDLRAENRQLKHENELLHAEIKALHVENEELKARIAELEKNATH